jgi:hypothetical protein
MGRGLLIALTPPGPGFYLEDVLADSCSLLEFFLLLVIHRDRQTALLDLLLEYGECGQSG